MMTNVLLAEYPGVFKAGAGFMGVPTTASTPAPSAGGIACAGGQVTMTARAWGDLVRNADPGYSGPAAGCNCGTAPPTRR